MKKWLFTLMTILFCSAIHASWPERVESLSAKVILQNTEGYFVLSDGSCWKAIGFSTRWRSLNEWWNAVQLVPKNYECVPNDWYLGTLIEVYSKSGNCQVNESDASNQEALAQCSHLFLNKRTEQVLFAIALHPADCIVRLFNESKKEGYDEGYSRGRLSNYQNGTDIYNKGRAEGYKVGYTDGVCDAMRPN